MRVSFDRFEFDTDQFALLESGRAIAMEPQVFDVLAVLILHRDRVVSKEELLDEVWGDRFVSESALSSRIKAVRQAVGDDGTSQRLVQTVRGRGYRFVAPVTERGGQAENLTQNAGTGVPPPSGIVTFLLTDVERSAGLWAADREKMVASLKVHDRIVRTGVEAFGGFVFGTSADSFAVAFSRASDAIESAEAVQAALGSADWPGPTLQVRMGIHLGESEERGDDYFGPVVNVAASLEAAGHGGQILISDQVRRAAGISALKLGTHLLRDAAEPVHVFQLGEVIHPPLRVVTRVRTNLPTTPSRLIGRDAVLDDTQRALVEHRLVTLTAAGGTGKTRLALAVGKAQLAERTGGVWFVDLTAVSDDRLVPETVAAGVGLVLSRGDPTSEVIDYLAGLDTLLILDNCEHLVDACADFLERLLARPGESRVLATTREFFGIDGERALRLAPLEVDGDHSAAVQLFTERAEMVDSAFALDDDDRSIVAELCRHLDGSPLAIELAAARSNVLSPTELRDGLGSRFEMLRGGRRRRSKRALDETLDWSYRLLDDEEQALLRALGIFVGSFDLDAVTSVAQLDRVPAVDLMDSLIAKSLVVSEREAGLVRFRLLETTSAYAERALGDTDEMHSTGQRHLDHYLDVCAPYDVGFWASTLAPSVRADRDNIRAAITWAALSNRWEDAGRLVFSASSVLQTQPEDLMALAGDCLEHLSEADPITTLGLHWVRIYTSIQFDFSGASPAAASLEASTDQYQRTFGAVWRVFFDFHFDSAEKSLRSYADFIDQAAGIPDVVIRSQLLSAAKVIAGWAQANLGRHEEALEQLVAAERHLLDHAPDTTLIAEVLASQGITRVILGDPDSALEIADLLDERGYLYFGGDEVRAAALLVRGDLEAARPIIREHASDAVTGRFSRKANNSLLLLALLAEAEHDGARAADLLMSAEHVRNPLISLSLDLARRLDLAQPFDAAQQAAAADQRESGRRAIDWLRTEMFRRGWVDRSPQQR